MNIKELLKIKEIIALSDKKDELLKEIPHIITNSHPNTLIEIAKGMAREGKTPIISVENPTLNEIEEHIIILTKKQIAPQKNTVHIEPSNEKEAQEAIISAALDTRPHIITPHKTSKKQDAFKIGRLEMLQSGEHCTIISDTPSISNAIKDTEKLAKQGINCTLLHCHTLEPFDRHTLLASASATKNIVCTPRLAEKVAKILHEHALVPITTAHNNEFIHAVRQSVKKAI
jgi:transketolase C-terminal domain/subunit